MVVANDVRVFRDVAGSYGFLGGRTPAGRACPRAALARLACEIYAGNGITAYLHDPDSDSATLSTPELSFVISRLGAAGVVGGVNMSASHNPPDDNGVKLYDEFGSQPVAPEDQQLLDIMSAVSDIRSLPVRPRRWPAAWSRPSHASCTGEYVEGYRRAVRRLLHPAGAACRSSTPRCAGWAWARSGTC